MAKNLLNKYVWLVETIYKAKLISFEDINLRWLDNDMSEGKPLSIRTFHKWRIAIEEMFGLIADHNYDVETVKFKVAAGQANYLRSLTLHQTQREIERTDEYSIFTVRLRPTFDFRQEILSQGSDIEVLEPKWFRDEVAEISKHMLEKYKKG